MGRADINEEKTRQLAACRLLTEQAYIDKNIILNVKVQIARLRGLGIETRLEPEYHEIFILLAARAKVRGARRIRICRCCDVNAKRPVNFQSNTISKR